VLVWLLASPPFLVGPGLLGQQTTPLADSSEQLPAPGPADELALEQSRIADKYAQLETLLIRMAAVEAADNPRRAALLKRAAKQSADRFTRSRLKALVDLLNQQQLKRALDDQEEVAADLASLLELLLSEDRPDRLKSEQARLREYVKEVERLIRLQKGLQGRTEGGGDQQRLAGEQGQLADRTGELAKQIQANEEGGRDQPSGRQEDQPDRATKDQKGGQGKDRDADQPDQADEGQKGQSQGGQQQSKDGDRQPDRGGKPDRPDGQSDAEKGGQQPSPSKRQQGGQGGQGKDREQPLQGGQSEDQGGEQEDNQQNPARQRIQAAEQQMRQARRHLEQAQREASLEDQERAKEELEKAKAQLEEILRQFREEEIERMLALLEGRFRKMLEMQLKVYEDTTQLDRDSRSAPDATTAIRAGALAFEQRKIVIEADKAHTLLLEEGSSVAFPETVDQMREAMQQAADRLANGKVGAITQGIEEEVIATLEELIAALRQAQQDLEQQQQQAEQMTPGQPQERPLVDHLAEIKMIRALQMRVNTRTKRYAKLLADSNDPKGQAVDPDLQDALGKLAEREARVLRITRDIVLGKNR
jgi:hypothetical protein